VAPGPEIRLSTVEIAITGDGSSNTEIARLLDRRDLRPGLRLNHGTYEQVKSNLLRAATGQGFLDAKFTSNELVIDPEQHVATVELKLETGPQYRFGPITITQDAIRDAAMQRLLRMREGEP
jgi:translocation and assembly module TamA